MAICGELHCPKFAVHKFWQQGIHSCGQSICAPLDFPQVVRQHTLNKPVNYEHKLHHRASHQGQGDLPVCQSAVVLLSCGLLHRAEANTHHLLIQVVLHTTFGPLDIELWPKEAPMVRAAYPCRLLSAELAPATVHQVWQSAPSNCQRD